MVTESGSSTGTVLVIHNDGRLRIGTVPLAVPRFGRTVLKAQSLTAGMTRSARHPRESRGVAPGTVEFPLDRGVY